MLDRVFDMGKATGRHLDKRLTALKVKSLGPGFHADGQGLYLRVEPNGSRRWVQRIVVNSKRCDIGLGGADLVPLAEARAAALKNRAVARSGGDPRQEGRARMATPTFAEAVDSYLAGKLDEFRNDKHRKQWRSTLDLYAIPAIGDVRVDQIETKDVQRVLFPIWSDKTVTASRLRGRIEAVLSWATVAGHRAGDNPARWKGNLSELLAKPSKVAKADNHPAVALDEVAGWFSALRKREGNAARALEFVALTAARSGEVRGMTWDEVDFDRAVWTIPAARMKMDRQHAVPLTPEAVALLRAMPRMATEKGDEVPFVFFAPRGGGALSDMALSAVMRRMQEAEVMAERKGWIDRRSGRSAVPHGLRSTFRDWAAERTEFPHEMAEIALAHQVGSSVERAYRRGGMVERRRAMMAAWGRFLCGAAEGQTIPLRSNG